MRLDDTQGFRSRLIRFSALLGTALALVAVSACGGEKDKTTGGGTTADKPGAGTAAKADPCSLLTTAEVKAAGVKATDPKPVGSQTGGQACNYGDDPLKGVQVIVQPGGGQPYFDQSKALLSAPKPLSGLGDQAVRDESNPQQVTVLVLQDDTVLSLGGSVKPDDAESLAKKALGRLGG